MERAARIAIDEMLAALRCSAGIERVVAVCFGQDALRICERALAELGKE